MEFRPVTPEDLAFVRQNPFEGAVKEYPHMEVTDDNNFTAIYEGIVVGVGGVHIKWDGVGLFWLMQMRPSVAAITALNYWDLPQNTESLLKPPYPVLQMRRP